MSFHFRAEIRPGRAVREIDAPEALVVIETPATLRDAELIALRVDSGYLTAATAFLDETQAIATARALRDAVRSRRHARKPRPGRHHDVQDPGEAP